MADTTLLQFIADLEVYWGPQRTSERVGRKAARKALSSTAGWLKRNGYEEAGEALYEVVYEDTPSMIGDPQEPPISPP